MIPNQSDSTPVNPKEISKAVFDDENVESIIAGNTSKSPQKISFTSAITNATMKNATQIQFNTILTAKVVQIWRFSKEKGKKEGTCSRSRPPY
jgi:hypothetical protein